MQPKVSVIIINWNQETFTADCIDSLKKVTYPTYDVIVVDNHSTDGSYEALSERYSGDATFIRNRDNLGFCGGNNAGIRRALDKGADYLCILNNDTVVEPDFLAPLVETAESDGTIGMVGGKVCCFEPRERIWQMGAAIDFRSGKCFFYGDPLFDEKKGAAVFDADYISGCLMLAKAPVVRRIGMFDEIFFSYFEDTDWCLRAKEAGYRVVTDQRSVIYHRVSSSITSRAKYYMAHRNLPLFMALRRKFHAAFMLAYPWLLARHMAEFLMGGRPADCRVTLMSLVDFVRGRFSKGRLDKAGKL